MEENEVKNKKSGKKIYIVIKIVLIVLIIAILGFILNNIIETRKQEKIMRENAEQWRQKNSNKEVQTEQKKTYNQNSNSTENIKYPESTCFDKPIIYLYPQKETELTVKLG